MTIHKIATIINFCSNDASFLSSCVNAVAPFSKQIIIPVCDHFFDGTKEDLTQLQHIYQSISNCTFIQYPYDPIRCYGFSYLQKQGDWDWPRIWHSTSRLIGSYFTDDDIEYFLFIDADEIYDSEAFTNWLNCFPYKDYHALRFLSYEYFREITYQSVHHFTCGLLIKKEKALGHLILNVDERMGLYKATPNPKIMFLYGMDEKPMIHHYSWVRTAEQMLKKVASWGHFWEKDWPALIKKEFSSPFSGKDFRTNSPYITVPPFTQLSCSKKNAPSTIIYTDFATIQKRFLTEEFKDLLKT